MAQDVVGPALPAVRLSGGYFADRDPLDTALGDLIMALMCPVGGRVMRRSFGGGLDQYLFAPSDPALATALRSAVVSAAKKWVPTIVITAVVVRSGTDSVEMNIKFALASDTTNERQKLLQIPRQQAIKFISARSN